MSNAIATIAAAGYDVVGNQISISGMSTRKVAALIEIVEAAGVGFSYDADMRHMLLEVPAEAGEVGEVVEVEILAAEYDMQPYEVAAALGLSIGTEVDGVFAREVLDLMVAQDADRA